ncbi:hypothetical protein CHINAEXTREME_17225 [Halobiforma lacisalsi AJ5]|uniref:Uncharacterized protein n=1 Tax=Natronobacterium lacisalsi AJ5 TaxID=358396 RepID=M0LS84_NATLA|nr:hypothetical protein [Halobiforma lacisalsi]APW99404.1 hypothetical protein CHINAEXTREME_17225 [Halobiforma lacisalsi AJ5]EMA35294.1 hypothetical protein C445_05558 [Halobiforma lacisalsi AJ5]
MTSRLQDKVHGSAEYQALTAQQQASEAPPDREETVADAVDPVIGLEKGKAEFWMQVAQLLLLYLILRELQRGGA